MTVLSNDPTIIAGWIQAGATVLAAVLASVIATSLAVNHFERQQRTDKYLGTMSGIDILEKHLFDEAKHKVIIDFFGINTDNGAVQKADAVNKLYSEEEFEGQFFNYMNTFQKFAVGYNYYFDREVVYDYFYNDLIGVYNKILPALLYYWDADEGNQLTIYRDVESMIKDLNAMKASRSSAIITQAGNGGS